MNWEKIIRDNKHLFEFECLKADLNIPFTVWKNNSCNHSLEIVYSNGKFLCQSNYFINDCYTQKEFMELVNDRSQ